MPPSPSPAAPNGGYREILKYLALNASVLRRNWRLIAITSLLFLTVAAIYVARLKRVYLATARVLILQHGGRPLSVGTNDPTRQVEEADALLSTHAMVISSSKIVERAIERVGREALPSLAGTDDPVGTAIANLKVSRPDRVARVLQIEYRAGARAEAIRLVAALLDSYANFLEESNHKKNGDVVSLISKARDDLSREVAGLEQQYLDFQKARPMLPVDEAGRSYIARRLDLWERASGEAMVRSVQLKAQLELGRKLAKDGRGLLSMVHALGQVGGDMGNLATVIGTSNRDSGSEYLRLLVAEQQQLGERFGPRYSRVRELQGEIDRIQKHQRDSRNGLDRSDVGDILASVEEGLKATESMKAEIAERFNRDQGESHKVQIDLLALDNIRTKLERHRALFNTVVDQLKQAQFVSDFSAISSQTIEPPGALQGPYWPRSGLILTAALAAGVLVGCGAAAAVDRMDQRIRSLDQLRAILGLPVMAQIPIAAEEIPGLGGEFGLINQVLPRSLWAESYRAARTNIEFLRRHQKVQVLMVASANSGDGKSVSASNLAISLAQAGRRVVLVDGDLRKPSLDRIYGLSRERGLAQLLGGLLPVSRVVQATAVPHLDLITTGPDVSNPAELLTSAYLPAALDELREAYDFVVIDSSPLFAVTDPMIVGAAVDAIVLVVRPTSLRHHDVERIKEILKAVGTPTLGAIVNGVGRDHDGFDYGHGYGYGYGYGYGNGYGTYGSSRPEPRPAVEGPPALARNGRAEAADPSDEAF